MYKLPCTTFLSFKNNFMADLNGKTVAILTENGFEEIELTSPKKALEEAGATVQIVSPQKEKVKGWNHDHWTIELPVDKNIADARSEDYDALMLPGGVINPDKLRRSKISVVFIFFFSCISKFCKEEFTLDIKLNKKMIIEMICITL